MKNTSKYYIVVHGTDGSITVVDYATKADVNDWLNANRVTRGDHGTMTENGERIFLFKGHQIDIKTTVSMA